MTPKGETPLLGPDGEPVRTKSGRIVTEQDIERWADEAERGYDLSQLKPRVRRDPQSELAGLLDDIRALIDQQENEQ